MLCVVCPPGDHEYVPPAADGVAVSVVLCPAQMFGELTLTVGAVFTFTVPVPFAGQLAKVYVTVYVVVVAGLTVILGVVCPPGNHEYVPPVADGVAVSVVLCPVHIVGELTLTVGAVFTFTVPVPFAGQLAKVYVTV